MSGLRRAPAGERVPARSVASGVRTLLRLSLRLARSHPLQVALLVVGVALGVAGVVSIDLATRSARTSFEDASRSLSGRTTHQVVGGPSGVDVEVYRRLQGTGLEVCAPVVEGTVVVRSGPLAGRRLRLLGLDPFEEVSVRGFVGREDAPSRLLVSPGGVLLWEGAGVPPGGRFSVQKGAGASSLEVLGLLRPSDTVAGRALEGTILCDVATAQEVLGMPRAISRVDLRLSDSEVAPVEAVLAGGARLVEAGTRAASTRQLTRAFDLNLRAISLLTLVVGAFLIYNTITFFVVQRRPVLGTLRALGATRGQLFAMILAETLVLATAGSVLGLGLGVVLGRGALQLVTRTINDLYFTLPSASLVLSPEALARGWGLGLAAAVAAALLPAWEATRVSPVSALRRSELERRASGMVRWTAWAALVVLATAGVLLAWPGRRLDLGYAGLVLFLSGCALGVPAVTAVLMRGASLVGGLSWRMAARSIVRSSSRTAVAVAALSLAVSAIVGVQVMVGSFRTTFEEWLDVTLGADVFVSSPYNTVSGAEGFSVDVARAVAEVPAVARVETARAVRVDAYGGISVLAVSQDISTDRRLKSGDASRLSLGEVLVSEPLVSRTGIGTEVTLPTDDGPITFRVAGVFYDYASERGAVMMSDATYRRHWRDALITSVAATAAPGASLEEVLARVEERVEPWGLAARSNRGLRQAALTVFDRTFAITSALRVLVAMVAFIGVLSCLMALQLERVREVGLLRAVGVTSSGVARLVLLETALMSLAAGLLSAPIGTGLAMILVNVIQPRSFGWTLAFVPRVSYFFEALILALCAGLLAAAYPAFRFARTNPAAALQTE